MAPQLFDEKRSCLASPLTRKLAQLVPLTADEFAVLRILQWATTADTKFSLSHVLAISSAFFANALYSITALTDCVVSAIPFAHLLSFFETNPRLAATIFWSFSCEAAMYAEHLIDVGRRSALERVAHFLLELLTGLQTIALAEERSYHMSLAQELIGDALGLSVPHVNRTLKQLREQDLVAIESQRAVIKNVEALSRLADFERTNLSRFHLRDQFAKS